MTTRAVFLDWYNTLARYEPPAESIQEAACRSYGIEVDRQLLAAGIAEADQFFYHENIRERVDKRLPNEQVELYTRYEDIVLKRAGVGMPQGMALPIWMKVRDLARGSTFALYDDVIPALEMLKARQITTVMISNISQDLKPLLAQLGLARLLDHSVSPREAGAEKPDPRIFSYALAQSGVQPDEAVHVGDQYHVDVAGARAAGIQPILIDRLDLLKDCDCPRIRTLLEIASVLP
ncbi:MAG: HAD-IA family hydrolase [Chloroflexi bacterium]|nr:HAD-IA family hydrolase [Chloroflexota bacterium]